MARRGCLTGGGKKITKRWSFVVSKEEAAAINRDSRALQIAACSAVANFRDRDYVPIPEVFFDPR